MHRCVQLFVPPWTTGPPGSSMGLPKQEYWSGLPFPPPGDLPNPGIKPTFPELQADSLPLSQLGGPFCCISSVQSLSGVRLCDPMDCSTPGFPVHQSTPGDYSDSCPSSWWCHPTISPSIVPFSSCLQSFPESESFEWVSSSHQVAKVLEFHFQHQSFQWIFRTDFL